MDWTPLCQTAYHGDLQMLDLLLGRADVEVNTPMCSPLFYAAREVYLAVVERLIKVESMIVDVKFRGQSPIQAAVQSGHAEIVRVLGRKQRLMQSDIRSA
ncbi:ankyrin [Penicillium angulare]|uniref:ankyrin n=1 Tax=Penicillium angulare TaxID=116970 RepID=UPI0025421B56|nr:ankyrin [Penicillium angulare]KAJ5267838.1 ankyrin [Penicillium angulare]